MQDEWLFPNRATPSGSSAYYSVRLSPPAARDALALLLGWYREIWSVLEGVSDPGVARLKLQWWREEIERSHRGTAQHPLTQALSPEIRAHRLPPAPFQGVIDAVEDRVRGRQPADLTALLAALEREMGALFELLARCQGQTGTAELARARAAGIACALVYLIRDLGAAVRKGRYTLPRELLHAAGLQRLDLTPATSRPALARVLAGLATAARDLAPAGPLPGRISQPPVVAIRAQILQVLLGEIEASGFDVLDRRISLTPVRKLWIAWRARRGSTWLRGEGPR